MTNKDFNFDIDLFIFKDGERLIPQRTLGLNMTLVLTKYGIRVIKIFDNNEKWRVVDDLLIYENSEHSFNPRNRLYNSIYTLRLDILYCNNFGDTINPTDIHGFDLYTLNDKKTEFVKSLSINSTNSEFTIPIVLPQFGKLLLLNPKLINEFCIDIHSDKYSVLTKDCEGEYDVEHNPDKYLKELDLFK